MAASKFILPRLPRNKKIRRGIFHQLLPICSLCNNSRSCVSRVPDSKPNTWMFSRDFKPDFDMNHIIEKAEDIDINNHRRKGEADVYKVIDSWNKLQKMKAEVSEKKTPLDNDRYQYDIEEVEESFLQAATALPNETHPEAPLGESDEPRLIEEIGSKPRFGFPFKDHVRLGENLDIIRIANLGRITGRHTYMLKGAGAQLQDALIRYTLDRLINNHGFQLLSVPDIIQPVVFEGCGMRTKGLHTQVFKLKSPYLMREMCLSGTAEVGIAGFNMNKIYQQSELPLKFTAVSRCFRAETADGAQSKGLYRVHQFTKVEMFVVTSSETGQESEEMFNQLVSIQRNLFRDIGLHFQILDMPAHDLGAPAYRKFDIEAWMPHKRKYGEISSTSNCTDYQSRRLNIKYQSEDGTQKYVHTLNGTACAVPRMIISILENFQEKDGSVVIPEVLRPYMYGQSIISRPASGFLHMTRLI